MTYKLPYTLMRGGTSKGPFFIGSLFPKSDQERDERLCVIMGSNSVLQVNGIGGGHPTANKAVLIYPSTRNNVDVEYLLCQVSTNKPVVDTSIDCGNMLTAVGPFAIESGFVKATHPATKIRIYSRNTHTLIEASVPTPNAEIAYEGPVRDDGINDPGAPIEVKFIQPAGTTTGKLFPSGRCLDVVDGIELSCVDVSMPLIIVAAESLGKTGFESKAELDNDHILMERLENLRKAGLRLMNLPVDTEKALAKICMVSAPKQEGNIAARYFIAPKDCDCHPTFAVTGAMCLAAACCLPGTIANRYAKLTPKENYPVKIEHPAGCIEATVSLSTNQAIESVSYHRTAWLIATGQIKLRGEPPREVNAVHTIASFFKQHHSHLQSLRSASNSYNAEVGKLKNTLAIK